MKLTLAYHTLAAVYSVVDTVSGADVLPSVEWRSGNARVDSLIEQLTPREKISLVHGVVDPGDQNQAGYVNPIPRLGIPRAKLSDGEAGINVVSNATAIPVQLNVAATWSRSAAHAAGHVTGREATLLNMDIALAPRVNILRDPITGNYWQSYSEDPFLNAQLGVAAVTAIQAEGAMADAKQIGPSSTGSSAGDTNSIVDMQTLQEVYWSAPGALLEAGAATLMCSYAQINGVPACQYKPLFDAVREIYNSTAIVVSDWGATHSTAESIIAGMDLEMPTGTYYGDILYQSIYVARNLSETYLDRALGHILDKYDAFGLLDRGNVSLETKPLSRGVVLEDAEIAYDIAVKSGVLLKNEGRVLPFGENASFAVIGPNGLQYSHGTNFAERAYGVPDRQISPLEAFESRTRRPGIPTTVGVDQEGSLIPSAAFTNLNGSQGLSRNDSTGVQSFDAQIDFNGNNELPANRSYEWQGYLEAPTAGYYTISLQRKMPDLAGHSSADYGAIFSIGSLSINGSTIASGYRTWLDGGARPWSNSIATRDGWDNIKAYVYLSAGRHAFSASIVGLLQQPMSVRLCWVTPEQREANIQAAVSTARTVDVPVVFAFANSPAQIGLTLDDGQDELVARIAAVNSKTIVVLNNAEPVLMPWIDSVSAVLEMGYAGQEGGWATVDLLLGNKEPQGRLPVTYPLSLNQTVTRNPAYPERVATADGNATFSEGVNAGYRWYNHTGTPVLFPFGYGLQYTSFDYRDLGIENASGQFNASDWGTDSSVFSVSFTVTNTGSRSGVEVPQIYIGPPHDATIRYPDVQFAATSLVGFDDISISAGGKRRVKIGIERKQLSFFDVKEGRFIVARGVRDVRVGKNVNDIVLVGVAEI